MKDSVFWKIPVSYTHLDVYKRQVLNQEAKSVVKALLNDGVIVVTAGSNVIRMLPPLIITPQHVDEFIEKLKKILKK